MGAGLNSLFKVWLFDVAKRCMGNLARMREQVVFKLAGAFGIVESDEVCRLDKIHLRPTRAARALLLERRRFID